MEKNVKDGMTVKELIKELKKCDSDAKVYYTLGGSCNFSKVTYVAEDDTGNEVGEDNAPAVIIGKLSW